MTEVKTAKFQPNSQIQLIEPSALGLDFILGIPSGAPFELVAGGKAALVNVRGPLSYESFMFDSYEAIKSRAAAAAQSDAEIVLLRISSPGGDVAGAFDCARAVRRIVKAAGKTYIAYSDSDACSAAYALMCTADEACASQSAKIGSIGAVAQYVDESRADAAKGLAFTTLTTGERKADGNPHAPMSDDTRAALQAMIDQAGEQFFLLVAEHRPLSVEKIKGLQAGVFLGPSAKSVGLIDDLYSWDELLARIQGEDAIQETRAQLTMAKAEDDKKDKDEARASLEAAAKSGNAKAVRALKAYDSDGDEEDKDKAKAESDDDSPMKEKKAKASADDDSDEEKKKEEAKSLAAKAREAAKDSALDAANARIKALEDAAEARAKAEAARESEAFYAANSHLPAELVEKLRKLPLDQAKEIAATVPKPFSPAVPTLAKPPVQGGKMTGASANDELNRKMGIGQALTVTPVRYEGGVQSFSVHEFGPEDPQ